MQEDAINSKGLNSKFLVAINQPLLQIVVSRQDRTTMKLRKQKPSSWRLLLTPLDAHCLLDLAVRPALNHQAGFLFSAPWRLVMHFYRFHVGDYWKDTTHLTMQEDLAYRRLIDIYYMNDGEIPSDLKVLSKKIRIRVEVVAKVRNEFFKNTDQGWIHSRCDSEIARFHKIVQKNQDNGTKGGRPKNNPNKTHWVPDENPNETQTKPKQNPLGSKPITSNQEPITSIPLTPLGGGGNVDLLTDSKPEASQDPGNEKTISTSRQTPEVEDDFDPTGARPHPRHLLDIWNNCCLFVPELPKVREATFKPGTKRWKTAKTRLKEIPDLGYWEEAIQRIAASPFCQGENDRGWKCDFDFVLKPDSHIKAFEGKYDRK